LTSHQQTSGELKQLCCALAVFVPFATVTTLLDRFLPVAVSPTAVWCWVQEKGAAAMARLSTELEQLAQGQPPTPEPLSEDSAALPLVLGADGVMVPFRRILPVRPRRQERVLPRGASSGARSRSPFWRALGDTPSATDKPWCGWNGDG